jgi:hypothetical protein
VCESSVRVSRGFSTNSLPNIIKSSWHCTAYSTSVEEHNLSEKWLKDGSNHPLVSNHDADFPKHETRDKVDPISEFFRECWEIYSRQADCDSHVEPINPTRNTNPYRIDWKLTQLIEVQGMRKVLSPTFLETTNGSWSRAMSRLEAIPRERRGRSPDWGSAMDPPKNEPQCET